MYTQNMTAVAIMVAAAAATNTVGEKKKEYHPTSL
jgi:hypothetical protein